MWYQILSYPGFLIRSTNRHGVHSPFVYDLVSNCFYDTTRYPAYRILKAYRKNLLKDGEKIRVKDFGAGSRVFQSEVRAVSAMTKTAGITETRQKLLYRLCNHLGIKSSLELGTSLGLGTAALALKKNNRVLTIEGCPATAQKAQEQFDAFGLNNITLRTESFEEALQSLSEEYFDLVYIDGHHNKESTLHYFKSLLPFAHNDSIFIFDDIYWSEGMHQAWQEIKAHSSVTVTIDTFYWGLAFFRREQTKENFTIRL